MISESDQSIFYVGTDAEVAHHAAPLQSELQIKIIAPDDVVAVAKPGDVAIFFSEHFDRFRDACSLLKQNRCATLYAIDGILEWRNAWENRDDEPACPWTMRPVLSHKVASISPAQSRELCSWGNAHKVEVVGLPRLDSLARLFHTPCSFQETRQTSDSILPFRVVIMTAKFPGFTEEQVENVVHGLTDLKNWFTSHPEIDGRPIEPIWRLTRDLDKQIGVDNQLSDLSGAEIRDVLSSVDAMITTPSTTLLEGMLAGIPVAMLEYNACPIYVPAVWQIHASDHIDGIVRELMSPPAPKIAHQQEILADQFSGIVETEKATQSATDRMVGLIRGMQKFARDSINDDPNGTTELEFPAAMLPMTRRHHASDSIADNSKPIALATLFPDREEFRLFETTELQSQLAHARREIEYRQALLDQSNKELAQAHEILFSIEKHPIAGPIVRARKKLMKWLGKEVD